MKACITIVVTGCANVCVCGLSSMTPVLTLTVVSASRQFHNLYKNCHTQDPRRLTDEQLNLTR
jgi:hypothetical protein